MQISSNLKKIHDQIIAAQSRFTRPEGSIKLLVVSKKRTKKEILEAVAAGQYRFGENYVQEALPKIQALAGHEIEWHFIGPIQSNKTKAIAEHFAWVQSVDRVKIAERLNEQRPASLDPLNICIQVNISAETTKSGASLNELPAMVSELIKLPNIRLRGLMAIPALVQDFAAQREAFKKLHDAFKQLKQKGYKLDTLSMGMSDDFVAAIAEGTTMVRIGSAIFGART